ncbi:MAG: HAMP domain-containing histidine kinase [Candidatus Eisenbacteria bacterium]|nr:HAMP domain-containing histidine kinase [Candidatus Eisenbacteria bacterium]
MVKPRAHGGPPRITSTLLRVYIFLGSGFLILALFFYTNHLIDRLQKETELLSRIFAQFAAGTIMPAARNEAISGVFSEMIADLPFPVIVTDRRGVPWTWHAIPDELNGVSVRVEDVSFSDFQDTDPENPASAPMKEVISLAARMDRTNAPIPFFDPRSGILVGKVHYGDPPVVSTLRLLPFIQAALVAIFILLGYLGYRGMKEGEQRSIWIGMAKETAHQLGTPISSLMGWLHLLRTRTAETESESVVLTREELDMLIGEMEQDVSRLNKIAYRFSNIGSLPTLKSQDLNPIIHEVLEYLRKRVEGGGKHIHVIEDLREIPQIRVNKELIQWVIENLFRNSVDALAEREGGTIRIATGYNRLGRTVKVTLSDDGRGMSPSDMKRAFYPGFSTKRRGWGLGLPLSRRIVEDYHGGRMMIEKSQKNRGTQISITLPA